MNTQPGPAVRAAGGPSVLSKKKRKTPKKPKTSPKKPSRNLLGASRGLLGASWTLTVLLQVNNGRFPLRSQMAYSWILKGCAVKNPVSTSIWIEGCPDSQLTCRCAPQDGPRRQRARPQTGQPESQTEPEQPERQRDRAEPDRERFPARGRTPPRPRTAGPVWCSLMARKEGRKDVRPGVESVVRAASGAKRRERVARGASGSRTGFTRG